MAPEHLKNIIQQVPSNPGIYKYFNKKGTIIYIGKAKNLKNRVRSYFVKTQVNFKTKLLVSKIADIKYTVVDTETEALLLENSLIKTYKPRYNILLKDDKSFPYIKITKEDFPKIISIRNPTKDGGEYFGPYASVRMMNYILDFIKRLYPTRNCNLNMTPKKIADGKFQICLEYQIGNCLGPCVGEQSQEDYKSSVKHIRYILKGNLAVVKRHLKEKMQEYSEQLNFEKAQIFKNRLDYLAEYKSRSTVVNPELGNLDVFNIASENKYAFVNHLCVSNGIIISTRNMEFRSALQQTEEEILESALVEVMANELREVDKILVSKTLSIKEFNGAKIIIPTKGAGSKLLALSYKNAYNYKKEKLNLYDKLDPVHKITRLLTIIKKDLRLKELPYHMECFDNSNMQGNEPVAACVVFRNGRASKKDYRHFNIKTVIGPDDFASMYEVVTRRYKRLIEEKIDLPQLIIVDGGKGQLSSGVKALKDLNIYGKVAILGIAKRLEELFVPNDLLPLMLDKTSETLKIIQRMRDEAHRFGITHHRKRREKALINTELHKIKGIGSTLAAKLLRKFKSVKRVREASKAEIGEVIGEAKANIVVNYFMGK